MGLSDDIDGMRNSILAQQRSKVPMQKDTLNLGAILNDSAYDNMNLAGYTPGYDAKTQNVSQFYDPRGLNQFRQEAMRKGESPWAMLSRQQQNKLTSDAREQAQVGAQSQTAQAQNRLAQQGGLTSGARERAQMQGTKNYMSMAQDLQRQNSKNQLGIGIQDEQNRVNQLGQLPGMELSALAPRYYDQKAMTEENRAKQQYEQWKADKILEAQAAKQQSQATASSGGK